jgi:hypothetical protein
MTNDKKIDKDSLAKVQGGKGRAPTKGSAGRTASQFASGSKGKNVSSKRR